MVTARMIKIIELLNESKENSYNNIAKELELSQRIVRYDIERINETLEFNKLPRIKKKSKGVLTLPKEIDLYSIIESNFYTFSQEERISIMKFLLLFDSKKCKLNKLSEEFFVSRSTIKNDLSIVKKEFNDLGIELNYKSGFLLEGGNEDIAKFMSNELSKYTYLITDKNKDKNSFEEFILENIINMYEKIDLEKGIEWINIFLEKLNYILTDQSYKWYISNVLVWIWYSTNKKEYPIEIFSEYYDRVNIDEEVKKINLDGIENLVPKELISYNSEIIFLLLGYTNKYGINIRNSKDNDYIEILVVKLISLMSQEMQLPFEKDALLYEGLANHIKPLIDRIKQNIYIDDDIISLLSPQNMDVYKVVSKVIKEVDILKGLKNKDEIVKIALYFMASIYRVKKHKVRNVLLVCGLGYGTSTMLKESLINQYKVDIIDIIPAYKIKNYDNWQNIDIIIATTKLNVTKEIQTLLVNPILDDEDCKNLELFGIAKKKVLVNYNSIKSKLDFLDEKDRLKVIDIIKSELGYRGYLYQSKISKLTDILFSENIRFVEQISNWKKSVAMASSILEEKYYIDEDYKFDIIGGIEKMGFYSIMDGNIALLHGSSTDSVIKTSMSLIVTKESVKFDGKSANIIFCLASKDKKEHVPAVIYLMRIIKSTDFIEKIKGLNDEEEIYKEIVRCEMEVMTENELNR